MKQFAPQKSDSKRQISASSKLSWQKPELRAFQIEKLVRDSARPLPGRERDSSSRGGQASADQ